MAAEPPSWHAVPSRGRCGRGVAPLPLGGSGGPPPENFRILRPQDAFWANSGQFGFLF